MYELTVLGSPRLIGPEGNDVRSVLSQPKRLALLSYLAVSSTGTCVRRDKLVGLLWAESTEQRARASLSQALSKLRRSLDPEVISTRGDEEVGVNAAHLRCDAVEFLRAVDAEDWSRAAEVYAGPLLDGFFLDGCPEFDSWLEQTRSQFKRTAVSALGTLTEEAMGTGDASARVLAERAYETDPLDGGAVRRLMQVLARAGQRDAALAVYETYAASVREERGIEPSAETVVLVQSIRQGHLGRRPSLAEEVEASVESLSDVAPAPPLSRSETVTRPNAAPHEVSLHRGSGATDNWTLLQEELSPLQLVDHVEAGGMGEVYLARDPHLRRTLAVKVLKLELASDPVARARFLREARVVAGLSHPNIVAIHSVGQLPDGTPYFVMDYVEGGNLTRLIDSEDLPGPHTVRSILGDVAAGLEAAHAHGVIHRDIKPSNVLLDRDTGSAVITDWGTAVFGSSAEGPAEPRLTSKRTVIGSPRFMSPEQLAGDTVGPASDMYSFGLLAFELATGSGPFIRSSGVASMAARFAQEPPSLEEIRPDVDADLSELVSRCLATTAEDRPSAHEAALRLGADRAAVLEWPPPGLDNLLGRGVAAARRLSIWVVVSAVLLAGLMGLTPGGRDSLPLFLAGSSACIISLVLALLAWLRALPLLGEVARAVRSGFDWVTVTDVLADTRGDTGALLVGSREYGGLPKSARRRLAALRRGRVVFPIVVGCSAIVLLIATAVAGAVLGVGTLLAVTAALVLAVWALERVEGVWVGRRRASVVKRRASLPSLTDAWYGSLRLLYGPRPARPVGRVLRHAPAAIGFALLAALATVVLPTLIVGTSGVFADALMAEALADLRADIGQMRELDDWRDLMLTPEAPGDGGPTLFAALAPFREALPAWVQQEDTKPVWDAPTEWQDLMAPFGIWSRIPDGWVPPDSSYYRRAVDGSTELDSGLVVLRHNAGLRDSLFAIANRGLRSEHVRWIESLVAHPSVAAFGAAARHASLDLAVAAWDSTTVMTATLDELDRDVADGIEVLEEVKYLEAALHVHHGRWDDAETTLKEVLTVGFLMSDSDFLRGRPRISSVQNALFRIATLYEVRGDPDGVAARLRATLGSLEPAVLPARAESSAWVDVSRLAGDLLAEGSASAAQQFSLARATALSSRCGSLLEVASGPDPSARSALTDARARLADSPERRAYWHRMIDREPSDLAIETALRDRGLPKPLAARVVPGWLASLTGVLGSPRVAGCRWYVALAESFAM